MEDTPRSRYTRSAATPSSASCPRPSAKGPRMKRVAHGTSAASSAKRSSAIGSRSSPMSVPAGPIRSATRRAWPPPPIVQSTATSPGCGPSTSISSPARTGMWTWVMSSRMAKRCGEVGDVTRELLVVGLPPLAVPDLEAVAGPADDDVLLEARVPHERRRDHHAARAVELDVEGVRGVVALELAVLGGHGVQAAERAVDEVLVVRRAPDGDTGFNALCENHTLRERRPELRRNRESVLGVERVVEGTAEGQVKVLRVG